MSDNLGGVCGHSTSAFWDAYLMYELEASGEETARLVKELRDNGVRCDHMNVCRNGARWQAIMVSAGSHEALDQLIIENDVHSSGIFTLPAPDKRGRRVILGQTRMLLGVLSNAGQSNQNSFKPLSFYSVTTKEYFIPTQPAAEHKGRGQSIMKVNKPSAGARYRDPIGVESYA